MEKSKKLLNRIDFPRKLHRLLALSLAVVLISYVAAAVPANWLRSTEVVGMITALPPHTWIVDDDGAAHFHTIQEAINAANPEDTIYVRAGTYNENPTVNKTLLLIGENKGNTIIIGNVLIEAGRIQFKGFSVEGDMPGSGITLSYSNYSVISDNRIASKRWAGITLREYSNNNTISNNIVVDNEYGIKIGYFSGPAGCNNNIITKNNVSNNTIGIEICTASTGNKIFGNTVENNSDGGILILDVGASNNKIYHNNILYNGEAWHRNAEDLSSNIWDAGLPSGGNFWSDYTGVDTNGDGIGDTPYVIDADSQDRYPFMSPWAPLPVITATIDTHPDVLSLLGRVEWISAHIELPVGYDVSDIDVSSIMLNETTSAELEPITIGDYDNDTTPDLMVSFNRTLVAGYILSKGIKTGNVTLTATGQLIDGTLFEGADSIRVRMPGDINSDGVVDGMDITIVARAFGSNPGDPRWNPIADQNEDNTIDGLDIVSIAKNFGKVYT